MDDCLKNWCHWNKKFYFDEIDSLSEIGNCYFVISPHTSELELIVTTLCFAYLQLVYTDSSSVNHPNFIPIFSFPRAALFSNYITTNILQLILIDPDNFIFLESLPYKFTEEIHTDPREIKVYKLIFTENSLRSVHLQADLLLTPKSNEYSTFFMYFCKVIYENPSFQDAILCKLIIVTLSQLILADEETLYRNTLTEFLSLLPDFNLDHFLFQVNNVSTETIISCKMIKIVCETIKLCISYISSQTVNSFLSRPDAISTILELLTLEYAQVYLGATSMIQNNQVIRQIFLVSRVFLDLKDFLILHGLIENLCNSSELGLVTFAIDQNEIDNFDKVTIQVLSI